MAATPLRIGERIVLTAFVKKGVPETTAVTTAARIAKITARIRIVFTLEDKSFFFK